MSGSLILFETQLIKTRQMLRYAPRFHEKKIQNSPKKISKKFSKKKFQKKFQKKMESKTFYA
jgi:hypothetical protein